MCGRQGAGEGLREKDNVIEELRSVVKTKQLIIEQQDAERKEAEGPLRQEISQLRLHLAEAQVSGGGEGCVYGRYGGSGKSRARKK